MLESRLREAKTEHASALAAKDQRNSELQAELEEALQARPVVVNESLNKNASMGDLMLQNAELEARLEDMAKQTEMMAQQLSQVGEGKAPGYKPAEMKKFATMFEK